MKARFLMTALLTSVLNLLLHTFPSALMDLVCSTGCMAVSAGFAASALGRARSHSPNENTSASREPLQLVDVRPGN